MNPHLKVTCSQDGATVIYAPVKAVEIVAVDGEFRVDFVFAGANMRFPAADVRAIEFVR
jgi:hypothetical protein